MNIACILAGGQGLRMTRADMPKQYLMLGKWPVMLWSMAAFDRVDAIDAMCVVADAPYHAFIRQWAAAAGIRTPLYFAPPGRERFLSANSALECVRPLCAPDDVLLFHDAVRPLVSARIILDNIHLAQTHAGVYTAIPSQDSAFLSDEGGAYLDTLLPRRTLYLGQTPQSFRFSVIARAHAHYRALADPPPVTDDCSLVRLLGERVAICLGDKHNVKITTDEDLLWVRTLAETDAVLSAKDDA